MLNQRRIVERLSVGFDGSQWGANGPELLTQAGHYKTRQCIKYIIFKTLYKILRKKWESKTIEEEI